MGQSSKVQNRDILHHQDSIKRGAGASLPPFFQCVAQGLAAGAVRRLQADRARKQLGVIEQIVKLDKEMKRVQVQWKGAEETRHCAI